jgi:hypothetical protein
MLRRAVSNALGLVGAAVGGAIGFFLFGWIAGQGFLAPFVPGGLLGLGCATLSAHRSVARGAVCAVAGLAIGFFADWWNFPFIADASLAYYVTHIPRLTMVKLIAIPVGGLLAYWLGREDFGIVPLGRVPSDRPASPEPTAPRAS